jgi:hypothetical protein
MQDRAVQYNTIQYNNTQHKEQNTFLKITIQHTRHVAIQKVTRKISKTIKPQKQVEPKMDESVLIITRYTKQSVNSTIQYSVTNISPRPTPHSTSLHLYTLQNPPHINSLPFTTFS